MSIAKWPRWIKQLSSIYRAYRNYLNRSRSCQDAIETNSQKLRWIENAITAIEKGRSKGLINSLAVERCLEAIEKLKNSFSKKRKTQIWMQSSIYSTKDPNNILSSQNHLLTRKMSSIYIQNTHTHTHTLNKSNQFYISKTSQDNLVSIH